MTTEATFRTAKGTQIRLFIRTRVANLADHNTTNPCWDLMLTIADRFPIVASAVDHPEHGYCLRNGTLGDQPVLVPVPVEEQTAVRSVVAAYTAERDRRYEADRQADRDWQERRDSLRRLRGSAYDPHCDGYN